MSLPAILLITADADLVSPFRSAARMLNRQVIWAETAAEGLKHLKRRLVCLIVSDDQIGPGSCGVEFLKDMQEAAPRAVRMMLLDPEQPSSRAIKGLNRGDVSQFIPKPIERADGILPVLQKGIAEFDRMEQQREAVQNLQYLLDGRGAEDNPRALQIERLCTMGEMAGSLIHKFNNTLTIMMGHLDLLQDEVQGTEMEKRLHLICQAASDGVDLARTLQEFVRTGPSERQTFSLNTVLTETIRMTEPIWQSTERTRRAPLEITTDLGALPNVHGNLSELREAITNLILNAIDALPKGGRIHISSEFVSDRIRLQVQDDGLGIPEDIREHIFDPFFTTKGKEGNGLGLSIVRRIVEEHSGAISVDSTPGIGTTFTIELPRTAAFSPVKDPGASPFTPATLS